VQWVSVWNKNDEYDRDEESVFVSLCSFVILHQDIVHLCLRFDCCRGRVLWVSVWNKNDEYDRDEDSVFISLYSFVILYLDLLLCFPLD
jgi:hypothetical protein